MSARTPARAANLTPDVDAGEDRTLGRWPDRARLQAGDVEVVPTAEEVGGQRTGEGGRSGLAGDRMTALEEVGRIAGRAAHRRVEGGTSRT